MSSPAAPNSADGPSGRPPERVVLVDEHDREVGTEEKLRAHQDGGVLHRAFSVFIVDDDGRVLLQHRAATKYHFGGLWTNACCGHPRPGEAVGGGAARRLFEEMRIRADLRPVGSFVYTAHDPGSGLVERELDHVFIGLFSGEPKPDPAEASGWRWIAPEELHRQVEADPAAFTPWFPIAWTHAAPRLADLAP